MTPNAVYNGFDINTGKATSTIVINILSMVMVGFSLLIVLIALIVSGFSITTSVEDDIQSIGILKALGYKSKQIVLSLVLQYGSIIVIGSVFGIVCSVFLLPIIGNIAAMSSVLLWKLEPSITTILLSFVIVVGLVILFAEIFATKTKKITPIAALRNGLETHNFKKNPFPLVKSKLNVNFAIVLKSIFSNVKQSVIILAIIIFVGFAGAFSMQMYTNLVEDSTAISQMVGQPNADIWLISGENFKTSKTMFDEIAEMEEVKKATDYISDEIAFLGITNVGLNVASDYSQIDKSTLYKGRFPTHDNEVAISGILFDKLDKTIGDIINVTLYEKTYPFYVTGLTEQMSNLGQVVDITTDGMKNFVPDYISLGILIDLEDGIDMTQFTSKLQSKYEDYSKTIVDVKLTVESAASSMSTGFAAAVAGVLAVMVVVIVLVLFLIDLFGN